MDDFDFIKAFADVDLLRIGAIARIVGRVQATLFRELVDAGLTEAQALAIMSSTMREFFGAVLTGAREMRQ